MIDGILAVWSDIDEEAEDDYTAWYEREHMFERLEVPGFRRARHYLTISGEPKYFTYFELDDPTVVASKAYLEQANSSSPWTEKILPHFRNVNRTGGQVVRRLGKGFGAAAMTMRLTMRDIKDPALMTYLGTEILPAIIERPGIISAQLWTADQEATLQPVKDRDLRPQQDAVSDLVIFIEGTTAASLQTLATKMPSTEAFMDAGAAAPPLTAIHQLLNGAEQDEAPPI
ncbi:MAG: hypothetical protein HN478_21740 [Rhodospirillaceae bacterium]|jgi:hypothetical protein|nr:hypothetical protein [Rhodospirillaceae bacterium]MBT4490364.1 hypothetical protein [Rhodospirillaceae bacterium]MBT5191229.1 hypothetical protein [Rhodospirillaceae bacterium]MBT5897399.1 hypothetical protein [Rhodospirillaceae bacterium]MBT6429058.1 hypothetical protein [Rhodospirillaceae bacterium]